MSSPNPSIVRVADVERAIAKAFPPEWAEPWDRVGLTVGDPSAPVRGVFVTLDCTCATVRAAVEAGANLLVTHHPHSLGEMTVFRPDHAASAIAFEAAARGVALVAAHTNLDRSPAGAASLARALGLPDGDPLERGSLDECLVITYVPADDVAPVIDAMSSTGAGRIGLYRGCSFAVDGVGRFEGLAGSSPVVGDVGTPTETPEVRIEMVCPKGIAPRVVAAARRAHPYEEPVILCADVAVSRGVARLGRVGDLDASTSLSDFARDIAHRLGCVPRVWGHPDARVERIATASGSAGSLVSSAIEVGAHVLCAGEVRYHDALDAVARGLAVIEVGHDVSEWPLVPVLADAVRRTSGLPEGAVRVDQPSRVWWTTDGGSCV